MRFRSISVALVFAMSALLVACGSSGTTRPYEKLNIEPDRTENGVDYYISVVNGADGSTYAVEFSTLKQRVEYAFCSATLQRLKPQLTLWCADTYTCVRRGIYPEMGTRSRVEDQWFPDYHLVNLDRGRWKTVIASSVKLMEIIEAYRERADLFAGVMTVN